MKCGGRGFFVRATEDGGMEDERAGRFATGVWNLDPSTSISDLQSTRSTRLTHHAPDYPVWTRDGDILSVGLHCLVMCIETYRVGERL